MIAQVGQYIKIIQTPGPTHTWLNDMALSGDNMHVVLPPPQMQTPTSRLRNAVRKKM